MARVPNPYKGKLVHIRSTWGNHAGEVDEETLYLVKQCGSAMATIVRVDPQSLQPYRRGQRLCLSTEQEIEEWRQELASRNSNWRSFKYSNWNQMFVPVGEAGWDPDQNF